MHRRILLSHPNIKVLGKVANGRVSIDYSGCIKSILIGKYNCALKEGDTVGVNNFHVLCNGYAVIVDNRVTEYDMQYDGIYDSKRAEDIGWTRNSRLNWQAFLAI